MIQLKIILKWGLLSRIQGPPYPRRHNHIKNRPINNPSVASTCSAQTEIFRNTITTYCKCHYCVSSCGNRTRLCTKSTAEKEE
nr:claudin-8 isoform X2 [Macaca nemestrina]